jgi:hypothetical protein
MDLAEARERRFDQPARHPWELARLDIVRSIIARHAPLGAGAVAIDVGCGDVFVAEQLGAGYPQARFYAVDTGFTDDLIDRIRGRISVPNVLPFASLDAVARRLDRPASLVLLMDVIEHVADDRAFLTDLVRGPSIDRETSLLITVPAYQGLFCSHDRFLGHYRRYSHARLLELVRAAGLRVVDKGSFFTSLLPVRLLQVAKERLLGAEAPAAASTGLVTWQGGPALSGLLKRMLVLDASVSRALRHVSVPLPGLSIYAVCRRSA